MNDLSPLNKKHLESEKRNFLRITDYFLENIYFQDEENVEGRPRAGKRDLMKCLLVMSYHSLSYRRSQSDIALLHKNGSLEKELKRPTLNKYMRDPSLAQEIQRLIHLSSYAFVGVSNCIVLDSTWFSKMIMLSGSKTREGKRGLKTHAFDKTVKLHIAMCKDTKIITHAIPTIGTMSDQLCFDDLVKTTVKNGFKIKTLIADAGYCSKDHYSLCHEYGIKAFIDFPSHISGRRPESSLWREQFKLFKENPDKWNETYFLRPAIESLFSAMKRKTHYYVRSRQLPSQFNEILLRALVHNLNIIAKNYLQ